MSTRTRPHRLLAAIGAVSLVLLATSCDDDDDAVPVDTMAPGVETTVEGDGDEPAVETAQVEMVDISFDPADITVPAGATVVRANEASVDHTSTSDDGLWDSGVVASAHTFEFTFDEAGTYAYLCEIHPSVMQGTITVE
jgi:plastocyanin